MELLEIEKELKGAQKEEALARYDGILVALDARRQAALKAGLPPEEFGRVQGLDEVIVIARKLLRLQAKAEW